MNQTDIDISVVVPAYNEAERLPNTLRRLRDFLANALAILSRDVVYLLRIRRFDSHALCLKLIG